MAKIVLRELRSDPVACADSIARAVRMLEDEPGIRIVVSSYRLTDGTARKLFQIARQRWPRVRRILYAESHADAGAKWASELVHDVAIDFVALRRATR